MSLFHHHRVRSAFPYVVIALTLGLILFIVFAYSGAPSAEPSASSRQVEEAPTVTDDDYRTAIRTVVEEYLSERTSVDTDIERLVLVEETLNKVLAVRVSPAYKDLHLTLATSLFQMAEGLRGEAAVYEEGRARFDQALLENPWIN